MDGDELQDSHLLNENKVVQIVKKKCFLISAYKHGYKKNQTENKYLIIRQGKSLVIDKCV